MNTSIRFPNLDIDFRYVGRSVSLFGIEITFYGMLITLGMLTALVYMILHAKRKKEDPNLCLEMMIPSLIGGVIGARLLYIMLHWELFAGKTISEFLDITSGGMSFLGGLLGGMLFGAVYCHIRKVSFMRLADTASMGLLITQIIGIWGNFFNRESFGEYTDTLFAMQIPVAAVDKSQITSLMQSHLAEAEGISYIQVHPLFLYESLWFLLLFVVLLSYTHRKKYAGEILLRYLAGYFLGAAMMEWLSPAGFMIPKTEIPVLPTVYIFTAVILWITAAVRRSLSKKREKYRRRRKEDYESGDKRSGLNYDEIHTYEDVSHEFLGTDLPDRKDKTEENEGSEHAETDEKTEKEMESGTDGGKKEEQQEEAKEEDTPLPQEAQWDDTESGGSSQVSEDEQKA